MTRGDSPGRHFSVPPISAADASGLGALKADGEIVTSVTTRAAADSYVHASRMKLGVHACHANKALHYERTHCRMSHSNPCTRDSQRTAANGVRRARRKRTHVQGSCSSESISSRSAGPAPMPCRANSELSQRISLAPVAQPSIQNRKTHAQAGMLVLTVELRGPHGLAHCSSAATPRALPTSDAAQQALGTLESTW